MEAGDINFCERPVNSVNTRKWSTEEDETLYRFVTTCGASNWSKIADCLPRRTSKQCRERWHNHLDPCIERIEWTEEEDEKLMRIHEVYGNQWSKIKKHFEGRSDNSIRDRYNMMIRAANKKVRKEKKLLFKKQHVDDAMSLSMHTLQTSSTTAETSSCYSTISCDDRDQMVKNDDIDDDLLNAKDLFTFFIQGVHETYKINNSIIGLKS